MYGAEGEDGERCLKLVFMPNDLCNKARTGSSCALQFTSFTDKVIFKHCLLLNRSTKVFVFFSLGNREGYECYILTIPFPTPIC